MLSVFYYGKQNRQNLPKNNKKTLLFVGKFVIFFKTKEL